MSPCAAVWFQFSMQDFNLLVTISQKLSALPSNSCIFFLHLHTYSGVKKQSVL